MKTTTQRILLHLADGTRAPVDPADVYLLEAEGNETRIRTRAAETPFDVREIGELEEFFAAYGFIRIHRSYVVNPDRIRLIRPRASDGGGIGFLRLRYWSNRCQNRCRIAGCTGGTRRPDLRP